MKCVEQKNGNKGFQKIHHSILNYNAGADGLTSTSDSMNEINRDKTHRYSFL